MSAARRPEPSVSPQRQTQLVMTLFERWQLTQRQQASMLGVTHSTINRYKSGQQAFSSTRDLQDRVGHLLAIHQLLRTLLPDNVDLVYAWPTLKNEYFDNDMPVEVIEQEGFAGLLRVREYLENAIR